MICVDITILKMYCFYCRYTEAHRDLLLAEPEVNPPATGLPAFLCVGCREVWVVLTEDELAAKKEREAAWARACEKERAEIAAAKKEPVGD